MSKMERSPNSQREFLTQKMMESIKQTSFYWMMACGGYWREMEYSVRGKPVIRWVNTRIRREEERDQVKGRSYAIIAICGFLAFVAYTTTLIIK